MMFCFWQVSAIIIIIIIITGRPCIKDCENYKSSKSGSMSSE